jgi:hypothetical protein
MEGIAPLLLVIATITLLWLLGHFLTKEQASVATPVTKKTSGVEVSERLHAVGLSENQVNELKAIVSDGDQTTLSKFLAFYKPGLLEIDQYIASLRERYHDNLAKPAGEASEIERIAASNKLLLTDQPEPYDFKQLSKAEIRTLLEIHPKTNGILTREFFDQFGEEQFWENFETYGALYRDHPVTVFVPKKDELRPLLESLAQKGVVQQGRKIHLRDRLGVLELSQLNQMAQELKLERQFITRDEATQTLAEIPGSAILLAMVYTIDDLFLIRPDAVDVKAVRRALSVYESYAKLIFRAHRPASTAQAV